MRYAPLLLALLAIVFPTRAVVAREPVALPPIIDRQIDDDTILVARLGLEQPGSNAISEFLAELPDPTRRFGMRAVDFHIALKNLQAVQQQVPQRVTEVFVVISTNDLPADNLALVVPVSGSDADRQAVTKALQSIGFGTVETVADGVIFWTDKARPRHRTLTKSGRPEFFTAFAAISESHLQIAISLGPDARRVLREFWPVLPVELGGGSGLPLSDGWKWIAVGVTPTQKPELQFVVQGNDESSVVAIEKLIQTVQNWSATNDAVQSLGVKSDRLFKLLTPTRQADRLSIVINEANGRQQQLMNEIAGPLVTRLQRNAVLSRTISNLKELELAMLNYHDNYLAFPAPAILSTDGKRLLSWRVAILPWLGHLPLYKEFHLNEPWDSEHNRKLIARMPEVFASANITGKQRLQGMTTYLGPSGENCLFSGTEGKRIRQIKDGTSNTISIVDVMGDRAVIWTQPEDLAVDMKDPFGGLTGQPEGAFRVAMCDGSVRAVRYTIKPETLRRLFQIDDGEPIDEDF